MTTADTSPETTAVPPAPASLPRSRGSGPYRVIMVCTGNICRSAMAEIVLGDRLAAAGIPGSGPGGVVVTSAGVSDEERGNPIDSRARRVLAEAGYGTGADDVSRATGIAITSHTAHRITDAEIAEADLLLAMTDSHWNVLQHRATALEVDPSRIRMYRELDPHRRPAGRSRRHRPGLPRRPQRPRPLVRHHDRLRRHPRGRRTRQ